MNDSRDPVKVLREIAARDRKEAADEAARIRTVDERIADILNGNPADGGLYVVGGSNGEIIEILKQVVRDVVTEIKPEHQAGRVEITEANGREHWSCKRCGDGYDDCDCLGYNEAIDYMEAKAKELGL